MRPSKRRWRPEPGAARRAGPPRRCCEGSVMARRALVSASVGGAASGGGAAALRRGLALYGVIARCPLHATLLAQASPDLLCSVLPEGRRMAGVPPRHPQDADTARTFPDAAAGGAPVRLARRLPGPHGRRGAGLPGPPVGLPTPARPHPHVPGLLPAASRPGLRVPIGTEIRGAPHGRAAFADRRPPPCPARLTAVPTVSACGAKR